MKTPHRFSWEPVIGWFINQRLAVLLLTAIVAGAGVYVAPFDWKIGSIERDPIPVDAIPDIGENQQIVFTEWSGRSPQDVEDQITYPLTSALLGIAGVRTVRSNSAFGFSTIYIIFEDDVDFYWSRSRVLEKLASLPTATLPADVTPTLGPDATALGQIFWYTLEGQDAAGRTVGGFDPDELRSIQDWNVRYALSSVSGVSEVASIGGFVREYQVDVDPDAMRAHGVTLSEVAAAVRNSNLDVGARTLEVNRVEYVVRGLGLVRSIADLEASVVVARDGTPIRIRDIGRVAHGPALRRGALDDEGAPAVGGVVVARFQENPLEVIARVKDKLKQIAPGLPKRTLPDGTEAQVRVVPFYDRTTLIHETLGTLSTALYQQILISLAVVLILLRNLRSSLLISAMLPLGVLVAFVLMKWAKVDANIMALGGVAIAIGSMVDVSIVFVENMTRHLKGASTLMERNAAIRRATSEVAPAVLTSVLTTVVSFLPVFGLTSSEFRLFAPLAYTKTFAMLGALALALVVLPGTALWVFRGVSQARPATLSEASWRQIFRSLLQKGNIRDWAMLGLGLTLAVWHLAAWGAVAGTFGAGALETGVSEAGGLSAGVLLAGILLVGLATYRLLRPILPDNVNKWAKHLEIWVAVVLVSVLLSNHWAPLGPDRPGWLNWFVVAGLIGGVLLAFFLFERGYPSLLAWILGRKALFLMLPASLVALGVTAWLGFNAVFGFLPQALSSSRTAAALAESFPGFGREYMPPFDEGSFLYMPTTMPHASVGEVLSLTSAMDASIKQIPEVDRVVGKLGRVDSALDPAPLSMLETVVTYHPEYRTNQDGKRERVWRDHIRSPQDIWDEIVQAAELPGLTSAPVLMPISARLVMLQSGMRAPMGIKVKGPTLESIEQFGGQLEAALKQVPTVRSETVFADRVVGKPYLEIEIDREAIGRHGLSVVDVQRNLQIALGGQVLTHTVEGRERYPVRVRYMREDRDSIEALGQVFIPSSTGQAVPLIQLAEIKYVRGPQAIKSEDTFLTSYVLFDKQPDAAEVNVVEQAEQLIEKQLASGQLQIPDGVSYQFAGSYENQVRSEQRLLLLIPLALGLVFVLLYFQFSRALTSVIIYSGVAVAISGAMLLTWLYAQPWFLDVSLFGESLRELFRVGPVNLSVAFWVGVIALVGIATDDGVVMSTYLKQRFIADPPRTVSDVRQLTLEAGQRRVRACLMTTATTFLALLPVLSSQGRGADVMLPMALPVVGGMMIELLTLFVVPVLYCAAEEQRVRRTAANTAP